MTIIHSVVTPGGGFIVTPQGVFGAVVREERIFVFDPRGKEWYISDSGSPESEDHYRFGCCCGICGETGHCEHTEVARFIFGTDTKAAQLAAAAPLETGQEEAGE